MLFRPEEILCQSVIGKPFDDCVDHGHLFRLGLTPRLRG